MDSKDLGGHLTSFVNPFSWKCMI